MAWRELSVSALAPAVERVLDRGAAFHSASLVDIGKRLSPGPGTHKRETGHPLPLHLRRQGVVYVAPSVLTHHDIAVQGEGPSVLVEGDGARRGHVDVAPIDEAGGFCTDIRQAQSDGSPEVALQR